MGWFCSLRVSKKKYFYFKIEEYLFIIIAIINLSLGIGCLLLLLLSFCLPLFEVLLFSCVFPDSAASTISLFCRVLSQVLFFFYYNIRLFLVSRLKAMIDLYFLFKKFPFWKENYHLLRVTTVYESMKSSENKHFTHRSFLISSSSAA